MFEYIVYKKDKCNACFGSGKIKVPHTIELIYDDCEECETKGFIYSEVPLKVAMLQLIRDNPSLVHDPNY